MALNSGARLVSVALCEMVQDTDDAVAKASYMECRTRNFAVQHILHNSADFDLLVRLLSLKMLHKPGSQLIFVLECQANDQDSRPSDLHSGLNRMNGLGLSRTGPLALLAERKPTA